MIALNTAMAEALTNFKTRVDALMKKGEAKETTLLDVLREGYQDLQAYPFDGNGYSDEWQAEAKNADWIAKAAVLSCLTSIWRLTA